MHRSPSLLSVIDRFDLFSNYLPLGETMVDALSNSVHCDFTPPQREMEAQDLFASDILRHIVWI